MADKMNQRTESGATDTATDRAIPAPADGAADKRRLLDAIEDDEVREVLRLPHRRKPAIQH